MTQMSRPRERGQRAGRSRSRAAAAAGLGALAAIAAVTGCDDAAGPPARVEPAAIEPWRERTWLDLHDEIAPELWLASREAKGAVAETDPAVAALRDRLLLARDRFGETARMIANRSVQLETMLAAEGIRETAPELLEILSAVAAGPGPAEGFGAICQYYFNLRKSGAARDQALAALRERHGPRR